jgi:cytochrome b561
MRYSVAFRIWHWLNAITLFGVFGTVLLRNTFLEKKANAAIIMDKLQEIGLSITNDQAIVIAKAIRSVMWDWHIYLGILVGVLLLLRLFLFCLNCGKRSDFWALSIKKRLVKVLYFVFTIALITIVVTGIGIYFKENFALSKQMVDTLKSLHEGVFPIVLFFVPIHVTGVILAEQKEESGIVSDLINGGSVEQ